MKDEYDFSKGKRGALLSSEGKTLLHIYIDDEVMESIKAGAEKANVGYQTFVNEFLKSHLSKEDSQLCQTNLQSNTQQYVNGAGKV